MVMGIAEAVVNLFTAGANAYKRKQQIEKLEKQLRASRSRCTVLEAQLEVSRSDCSQMRLELARLDDTHMQLVDKYNELATECTILRARIDKRDLDDNPYN